MHIYSPICDTFMFLCFVVSLHLCCALMSAPLWLCGRLNLCYSQSCGLQTNSPLFHQQCGRRTMGDRTGEWNIEKSMKSSLVLIVGDVTNTYLMKQPFCRLVPNNAFISFSFPPFIQIKSNQMLRVHLDSAKPRPSPPLVHTYWMLYALGLNVRTYWMLYVLALTNST